MGKVADGHWGGLQLSALLALTQAGRQNRCKLCSFVSSVNVTFESEQQGIYPSFHVKLDIAKNQ